MIKRFIFLLCALPFIVNAQFAPAAGQPGSTAIKKDSSIIINWATGCMVLRGLQDISNTSSGYATVGDSSSAVGPADGVNVVSLGDGGTATLTFQFEIKNLAGPDFCVFENSFDPGFLELAFVEVSSDGINYTRFPATCNVQNTVQIGAFDASSDPTKIDNLAGKYIGGYGVPFDLQELQGTVGLDINAITHVKIIDVVGCIQTQYTTYDKNNNKINDPWSTPFASGGFDLDAVGVMHEVPANINENDLLSNHIRVYPTITTDEVYILNSSGKDFGGELYDVYGNKVLSFEISGAGSFFLKNLNEGVYFLKFKNGNASVTRKIIKRN
ncbi:MAG: T9SS type A sorting domain-containing protein [Bacteroidia bacterium]